MIRRNVTTKIIIFLFVVGIALTYLDAVFSMNDREKSAGMMKSFYENKKNTLDAAYIGSSAVNRYWIAPLAYNDYGMAVHSVSTAMQPLILAKYLMKEIEKTQNVKLFIVELRPCRKDSDSLKEIDIRRIVDNMKWSQNKIDAINASLDYAATGTNNVSPSTLHYYFPLSKYHNRWSEDFTLADFVDFAEANKFKGFYDLDLMFKTAPQVPRPCTSDTSELADETESVIVDLLDYCDTLDAEVLFVCSPFNPSVENQKKINRAIEITKSRGYKVLNFNTPSLREATNLDYQTDFYDLNHVNLKGAKKYTNWFGNYIQEHYNLKNHKGDPQYESWEKSYSDFVDFEKSNTITKPRCPPATP